MRSFIMGFLVVMYAVIVVALTAGDAYPLDFPHFRSDSPTAPVSPVPLPAGLWMLIAGVAGLLTIKLKGK